MPEASSGLKVGMRFGLVFPQTEIPDDKDVIREYVQAVEAEGFDYPIVYERVLGVDPRKRPEWDPLKIVQGLAAEASHGRVPVDADQIIKRAPYDYQSRFQEPMVLHAFLSGVTSRIELATGIVNLPQRVDPSYRPSRPQNLHRFSAKPASAMSVSAPWIQSTKPWMTT